MSRLYQRQERLRAGKADGFEAVIQNPKLKLMEQAGLSDDALHDRP